jgi:hypothetical protein
MLLTGCAYLRSSTSKAPDGTEKTIVRVVTFFDSQSQLTKFRNTTGQIGNGSNIWSYPAGTTIGAYDAYATSTNLATLAEAMMKGAMQGMVEGAKK